MKRCYKCGSTEFYICKNYKSIKLKESLKKTKYPIRDIGFTEKIQ